MHRRTLRNRDRHPENKHFICREKFFLWVSGLTSGKKIIKMMKKMLMNQQSLL